MILKRLLETGKRLWQMLDGKKGLLGIYLIPPVLMALFIGSVYGPVLLDLTLPDGVEGFRGLFALVTLKLFELFALACGLAGLTVNLIRMVNLKHIFRSLLLVLLALGYIAMGGWFVQLEILFAV